MASVTLITSRKKHSHSSTLPSGGGFLLKGIQTKQRILNNFIKKKHLPTEAEQTSITVFFFSWRNTEYNLTFRAINGRELSQETSVNKTKQKKNTTKKNGQ